MRSARRAFDGSPGALSGSERSALLNRVADLLANDTQYGVAAPIWTRTSRSPAACRVQIRAGAVWVNGWAAIDRPCPGAG